jgi:hypothetical protein
MLCKIKYFYKMTYGMGIVVLMKNVQRRGLKKLQDEATVYMLRKLRNGQCVASKRKKGRNASLD